MSSSAMSVSTEESESTTTEAPTTDDDTSTTSSSDNEEDKEDFYSSLISVQQELVLLYSPHSSQQESKRDAADRQVTLILKIEDVMLKMMQSIKQGEMPSIILRNTRNWDNCVYDSKLCLKPVEDATTSEVKFADKRSRGKYALLIFVLGKIHKLLATKASCTKRELFYQNCDKITTQDQLDSILNDITCLLDSPLHELNIYATSKGLIYGEVEITTNLGKIDCSNAGGTIIPHNVCNIINIKSDAHFVLVIEKDAVFQKLLEDNIMRRLGPCILITGKGFPDINTRLLLKMLWNFLAIPMFALVDPDPWGIEIMCVYRFGSLAMSHQAENMAVPSLRWLGIFPSEIDKFYDINEPLTDKDKAKIQDILNRPYIKGEPLLKKEIQILLDKNYKAEIEGIETAPAYLAKVYLKLKIRNSDYL